MDQPVLKQKGDRVRIQLGIFYVAAPASENGKLIVGTAEKARTAWGNASAAITIQPGCRGEAPVLSATFDLGSVAKSCLSLCDAGL